MSDPAEPSRPSQVAPNTGARASRILVIDDDDIVRRFVCRALEISGFAVAEATNGFEAMTLFRQFRPDAVVTDLLMPERDGIETIIELRRHAPQLPILAISGGFNAVSSIYLRTAEELGANAVLSKPFTVEQLLAALKPLIKPAQGT